MARQLLGREPDQPAPDLVVVLAERGGAGRRIGVLAVESREWRLLAQRAERADEINGIVADWTAAHSAAEVEAACIAQDVPVGTAYSAADIAVDPHMAARGDLVTVDDPVLGALRQQAPFPRFDAERPQSPGGAPRLGEHNDEVWCGLVGLSPEELARHRADGIV